jgi:hypothetical protein
MSDVKAGMVEVYLNTATAQVPREATPTQLLSTAHRSKRYSLQHHKTKGGPVDKELTSSEHSTQLSTGEEFTTNLRRSYIYGFGVAWIAAAIAIVALSNYWSVGSQIKLPFLAVSGVSTFAIFYILAQFVERVTEPISNSSWFGQSKKVKDASEIDQKDQSARTIALWCAASALGIVLCYYTVGLFEVVGVSFLSNGSHLIDALLSGVIVGAGTKPVHDLIGLISSKNP